MSIKSPTPPANLPKTQKILRSYWETSSRGIVMLEEDWKSSTKQPPLFLHPDKEALKGLSQKPPFFFGLLSGYCVSEGQLTFILNPEDFPRLPWEREAIYVAGDFNAWNPFGDLKWKLKPEAHGGVTYLVLRVPAKEVLTKDSPYYFKFVTERHWWLNVPLAAPNHYNDGMGNSNYELSPKRTGKHIFSFELPEGTAFLGEEKLLWATGIHKETSTIQYRHLLLNLETESTLGAFIWEDTTHFQIFAPRAEWVNVSYYKDLDKPNPVTVKLIRQEAGLWVAQVHRNLHGYYYYYQVEGVAHDIYSHFNSTFKILDPYALATVGPEGPGIIIDKARIPKQDRCFNPPRWEDLVILETHVRDLIARAPIPLTPEERLGFAGLEKWVRTEGSYLRDLGINAIELQPIQEFDAKTREEYHWGYMPCNYFSPASQYAQDPKHASQIQEFQSLVRAFHDQDLAVIIDVVYNHVGEPNHLLHLDKYHYFDTNDEGYLMNYSGCGNDLRTEAPMTRRLIIDSLKHLVKTYDVDGFRFDLGELIGTEVLSEVEHELKKIKPSIILIAEPWSFRGHIAQELKETGIASWNDGYREFIKDYLKGHGNREGIEYFIGGCLKHLSRFPAQSLNYLSSHDDHCWLDKITEAPGHNGELYSANDRRRTFLMVSLLLSSIGIPMLAQGTEMLHSKQGVNNTYQRGDLNALDYGRIIAHSDLYSYVRSWIRFRLSDLGKPLRLHETPRDGYFRFFHAEGASSIGVLFNAGHEWGPHQVFYAINPHTWSIVLEPIPMDPARFKQIADHNRFDINGLDCALMPWLEGQIAMPPLSCALWVLR